MNPPTKDQADIGIDNPTIDASDNAILEDGTDNKDMARQEYKDESDINYMLSRFGITSPRGAPVYGEWDDSIDLQIAIESVREARQGYNDLPRELRDKFPTMEEFLRAVDNGELELKPERETPAPPQPPPA